jgi:cytochrome P450
MAFYDPEFYAGDSHAAYAWLRHEAPVYWHEPGGFWVLSTYADIKAVSSDPDAFSNEYGATLAHQYRADRLPDPLPPHLETLIGESMPRRAELRRLVQHADLADPAGFTMNASDPPRHTRLRALFHRAFTPRAVAQLEPRIREIMCAALDRIEPGSVVDFVEAISFAVPSRVIAELVGVPDTDGVDFMRWLQALMMSGDVSGVTDADAKQALVSMHEWLHAQVDERRRKPAGDLVSAVVAAAPDDITAGTLVSAIVAVLGGGADTTMNAIGGAAVALAEHPAQREVLVRHPELIITAAHELLRWVSPIISFARTAKQDVELHGQRIARGDMLVLLYASANRDETIWPEAHRLDVRRAVDPSHLSFGHGEHNCLGRSLAQLEMRIVFEELLQRFPSYEVVGPSVRRPSVFMNTTDRLPVRFAPVDR